MFTTAISLAVSHSSHPLPHPFPFPSLSSFSLSSSLPLLYPLLLSIANLYIKSPVYLHVSRAKPKYSNFAAYPATFYSCSPDMVQGYFRGKSASCTCRLTDGGSGNPRGTADWYQGDTVQTMGSGGSLTVTYQPNSEYSGSVCKTAFYNRNTYRKIRKLFLILI